ncbi:MAG TPA: ROK family transcriptional regulator [Trebonia sp.]|jgi:predicted NBD/HSP70 family sugar kinase|nr:ROK family transcriptional regulator [Trebonia sp.]
MVARKRGTVRDLRRETRSVALRALYLGRPCGRHELSERTGLSPASVTNVVRELLDEGILTEAEPSGPAGGRRRALLRIAPDYGYVIGVDIGETRVEVKLFDLAMAVRARAVARLDPGERAPGVVVERIAAGLDAVLADSGVAATAVLGAGVGVPGIVEEGPEALVHCQAYGWDAVPLERLLRSRTSLPLRLENCAKTMGQAELWFGAGRGAQHAVVALIGTGVGAALISGGSAYRGAMSSAGEWGHTRVMVGGRTCRCGARGCLEAYVGAQAILERYGERPGGDDEESALAALVEAARTSARAAAVLDETAVYLGAGLANLVSLVNPERIVLGGWAGLLLGTRLPAIREAARSRSLGQPFAAASIVLSQLGPEAATLGAATLPVELFLDDGRARTATARR